MRTRRLAAIATAVLATASLAACGEEKIGVAKSDPDYAGAYLFQQRCSGCHTFDKAGTQGSAVKVNDREIKDGPNFNVRHENYQEILYAIRNGGFSSSPMPQNIVTGCQAEQVASFVAKYSGDKAPNVVAPKSTKVPREKVPAAPSNCPGPDKPTD